MRYILPMLIILWICAAACFNREKHRIVTTFAGSGLMGSADGWTVQASFANLMGLAVDADGNVYVADSHNNLIRRIKKDGMVTTIAGSGAVGSSDGLSRTASFFNPAGIAIGKNGCLYIADTHNNLIRQIDSDGMVKTITGRRNETPKYGVDTSVQFDNPVGIVVDSKGNVFVADQFNDAIRKIDPAGIVTNFAGGVGKPGFKDGLGSSASFYLPCGLAIDSADNIYVTDTFNNLIRKINQAGMVTTIAGKKTKGAVNGNGVSASFSYPAGISIDKQGNLFVADAGNNKIRRIAQNGEVSTFAGNGKPGSVNGRDTTASFFKPYGVAVANDGSVYVADYLNNMVRKISY